MEVQYIFKIQLVYKYMKIGFITMKVKNMEELYILNRNIWIMDRIWFTIFYKIKDIIIEHYMEGL